MTAGSAALPRLSVACKAIVFDAWGANTVASASITLPAGLESWFATPSKCGRVAELLVPMSAALVELMT